MRFQIVHGTQEEKPLEVEYCGAMVFVRRDIRRVTETIEENEVEMWEYEEAYGTIAEYADYLASEVSDRVDEQQAQIDYTAMMTDTVLEG